jgi:hypothetical protein
MLQTLPGECQRVSKRQKARGITDDGHGEALTREVRQHEDTRKALVLGGIVVLQGDLELDGLLELALLFFGAFQDVGDGLVQNVCLNLAHFLCARNTFFWQLTQAQRRLTNDQT